jgi:hypothetical protein
MIKDCYPLWVDKQRNLWFLHDLSLVMGDFIDFVINLLIVTFNYIEFLLWNKSNFSQGKLKLKIVFLPANAITLA